MRNRYRVQHEAHTARETTGQKDIAQPMQVHNPASRIASHFSSGVFVGLSPDEKPQAPCWKTERVVTGHSVTPHTHTPTHTRPPAHPPSHARTHARAHPPTHPRTLARTHAHTRHMSHKRTRVCTESFAREVRLCTIRGGWARGLLSGLAICTGCLPMGPFEKEPNVASEIRSDPVRDWLSLPCAFQFHTSKAA